MQKYNHKAKTLIEATGINTDDVNHRFTDVIHELIQKREESGSKDRTKRSIIMEAIEKELSPREMAYVLTMILRIPQLGYGPEAANAEPEDNTKSNSKDIDFGDMLNINNK